MKQLKKEKAVVQRKSRLDLDKSKSEEIFNDLAKFMINNRNRNSATRAEAAKYFDCSFNKATRMLNGFVSDGKLTRDAQAENLYWLVLE